MAFEIKSKEKRGGVREREKRKKKKGKTFRREKHQYLCE